MISQEEITNFCIEEFSFLPLEYGSKAPRIKKESWTTEVRYLWGEIAVEINLDFRDLVIELFIVRLENGKIPDGYIFSTTGKKIRVHLMSIITEKNWLLDEALLRKLHKITKRAERDSVFLKEELHQNHLALTLIMDKILEQNTKLFG